MDNLNEEQLKTLKNLKDFAEKSDIHANLPVVEELRAIREALETLVKKESPEPLPHPEVQKIAMEGVSVLTLKGDKGDQGEKGDSITGPQGLKGDKGDSVVGPQGLKGEDGESITGPAGENGKDGSPDTGDQIIDKINEAEGLIKKERIEGLDEMEKGLEKKISSIPRGVGNRSYGASMKFYDLSAQTNGSLKVFTVPKSIAAIAISSDFPTILMEGNGFTLNATRTQLTLTVANAPSSGSQLLYQYSSLFN